MDSNKDFWDQQYRLLYPKMIGVCRRYISDIHIIEDLVQEAFITAINKYDTYSGFGKFENWIRKIVINTVLIHLRNQKLLVENFEIYLHSKNDTENIDEFSNEEDILSKYSVNQLLVAIDNLPDHHRVVFNMYVIDNYSHNQIAAELNINLNTSKSHLLRARKELKQILLNQEIESDNKTIKRFLGLLWLTPISIDKLYKNRFKEFTIDKLDKSLKKQSNIFLKKISHFKIATLCISISTIFAIIVLFQMKLKPESNIDPNVFLNSDTFVLKDIRAIQPFDTNIIHLQNPPKQEKIFEETIYEYQIIKVNDTIFLQ